MTTSTSATAKIAASIRPNSTTVAGIRLGHVPEDLHQPDHRAGQADLPFRDKIRDVALERTACDVRLGRSPPTKRPPNSRCTPGRQTPQLYERVLERNLTEPGLGKAAKIGTEVR